MTRVLAIDGSPRGEGRTHRVLDAVLSGASDAGAQTTQIIMAGGSEGDATERCLEAIRRADAFVFGSPVHRASYAAPLKALLDRLPRGRWGETEQPITARAVGIVLTGASWTHYLALNDLRNVLSGFFAAHVLTPGLYVPAEGFDDAKELTEPFVAFARDLGAGLTALDRAIADSPVLRVVEPQI